MRQCHEAFCSPLLDCKTRLHGRLLSKIDESARGSLQTLKIGTRTRRTFGSLVHEGASDIDCRTKGPSDPERKVERCSNHRETSMAGVAKLNSTKVEVELKQKPSRGKTVTGSEAKAFTEKLETR